MASEIRVDKINSLSGVGTVTLSPTGVDISGITTVQTLKVGTGVTASEDGDIFFTGVCTATTFTGSGANLTSLPAAQLSGTLPALSAANLTSIPAANVTGTLPAISGANLTNLPAANVTGTLPAISGANLTSLTAANLTGSLPAISAASCTSIPAANIVGLATAGFNRSGGFPAGVEEMDLYRLTSGFSAGGGGSAQEINANWARPSDDGFGHLGTGMSQSSGVFTFPSTGFYRVYFSAGWYYTSDSSNLAAYISYTSNNGSAWDDAASGKSSIPDYSSYNVYQQTNCEHYLDITDVSNQKVRFRIEVHHSVNCEGTSDHNRTYATFTKLADT